MLFWCAELKYLLPPDMSESIVHASLFQSKRLIEAMRDTMRRNMMNRNVGSSLRK